MIIFILFLSDEFCEEFPHNLIPTPGYWIECSRQKIASDTIWDESESEHELNEEEEEVVDGGGGDESGAGAASGVSDDFTATAVSDGAISAVATTSSGIPGRTSRLEIDHHCLPEDDEDYEDEMPRKKTVIEEQWEKNQGFELTSVEQETYEKYFYGTEHWNYFTNDEDLGPVILSIKQETLNGRDQFR